MVYFIIGICRIVFEEMGLVFFLKEFDFLKFWLEFFKFIKVVL